MSTTHSINPTVISVNPPKVPVFRDGQQVRIRAGVHCFGGVIGEIKRVNRIDPGMYDVILPWDAQASCTAVPFYPSELEVA